MVAFTVTRAANLSSRDLRLSQIARFPGLYAGRHRVYCAIVGDPVSGEDRLFPTHRYITRNESALRRKIFGGYEYEWFDPRVEVNCHPAPSFAFDVLPTNATLPGPVAFELWSNEVLIETLAVAAEDWTQLNAGQSSGSVNELAFATPLEPGQSYQVAIAELPPGFECYVVGEPVVVGSVLADKALDNDPRLNHSFELRCTQQ